MKAPIELDVTGDLTVQILAAYARMSTPSAVLNRVSQALELAAGTMSDRDAALVRDTATTVRALAATARETEDALYL